MSDQVCFPIDGRKFMIYCTVIFLLLLYIVLATYVHFYAQCGFIIKIFRWKIECFNFSSFFLNQTQSMSFIPFGALQINEVKAKLGKGFFFCIVFLNTNWADFLCWKLNGFIWNFEEKKSITSSEHKISLNFESFLFLFDLVIIRYFLQNSAPSPMNWFLIAMIFN